MKLRGIPCPGWTVNKKGAMVKNKKRLNVCARIASQNKVRFARHVPKLRDTNVIHLSGSSGSTDH